MRSALAVRRVSAPARRATVAAAVRLSGCVRCSSSRAEATEEDATPEPGRWVDIRVDTSGLAGRDAKAKDAARARGEIPDNSTSKSELSPLGRELKSLILARGPLSIAEFMRQALLHPVHGYYMREGADVFGRRGDFVTSPEVTQVFGELIGVWLVAMWHQMGSPPLVRIVEMGPGLGTLMRDALRAASRFPGFYAGASVHMVEASPALRRRQADALACAPFADAGPDVGVAGSGAAVESMRCGIGGGTPCSPVSGPSITWHGHVSDVPRDGAFLCVAHELFDALPVHQIERTARGWRERLVEVDDDEGGHHFRLALARCETPASRYFTDVHPLSAPKHVPDDDPSLAVWRLRPGAPPARLDGLERELGLAPAEEAKTAPAAADGGTRAALEGVRSGRDGIGALRRAMNKGGGGPKSPAAAAREQEELPERRAEAAVTEQRRRQLETLERDMRDEARRAGVDVDGLDAEVRAESAARAATAIRTSAERVEHMTRHVAGKRAAALRAATASGAEADAEAEAGPAGPAGSTAHAAVRTPVTLAAGSGGTGFLKGLRPKAASSPAQPAKPGSSDLTPSLAQIADHAAAQHRELEREGRLETIARAAIRGRTLDDLEREAASAQPGASSPSSSSSSGQAAAATSTNGWLEEAEVGSVVEFSPQSCVLAAELSARVGDQGGAALIIDYGNDFAPESTVRGIREHAFTSFLERPGDTDVTADVDFRGLRHAADVGHPDTASVGPVPQGEFLQRMGIRERTQAALELLVAQEADDADQVGAAAGSGEAVPDARAVDGSDLSASERLVAAVERIVNPESGMGGIYKAMAIVPKSMTAGHGVPGFPAPGQHGAAEGGGDRA